MDFYSNVPIETITFDANIGKCVVEKIGASNKGEEFSYVIFESGMVIKDAPVFTQVPDCGYKLKVDISGIGKGLTYDPKNNKFSLELKDAK